MIINKGLDIPRFSYPPFIVVQNMVRDLITRPLNRGRNKEQSATFPSNNWYHAVWANHSIQSRWIIHSGTSQSLELSPFEMNHCFWSVLNYLFCACRHGQYSKPSKMKISINVAVVLTLLLLCGRVQMIGFKKCTQKCNKASYQDCTSVCKKTLNRCQEDCQYTKNVYLKRECSTRCFTD